MYTYIYIYVYTYIYIYIYIYIHNRMTRRAWLSQAAPGIPAVPSDLPPLRPRDG